MVCSSRHPFGARSSKMCPRRWKYDSSIKAREKKGFYLCLDELRKIREFKKMK